MVTTAIAICTKNARWYHFSVCHVICVCPWHDSVQFIHVTFVLDSFIYTINHRGVTYYMWTTYCCIYGISEIIIYACTLFAFLFELCMHFDFSFSLSIFDLTCIFLETWYFLTCSANIMMTSSNGSIFRVTGLLGGESIGNWWIPLTKASDAELWYFLWSAPEQTVEHTIETLMIWDAIALIMASLWCYIFDTPNPHCDTSLPYDILILCD